jgi:AraC-like DNA-binding protein
MDALIPRLEHASVAAFLAAPVGRYVETPTFLLWCSDPRLCGAVYRGRWTPADVRALFDMLAAFDHPSMAAPFDVLTDARLLEGAQVRAYDRLLGLLRPRVAGYAQRIGRNAIVRPRGPLGAMIAGVYAIVEPRHDWRAFAGVAEGLAWLGRSDARAVVAPFEALASRAPAPVRALAALREIVMREGRTPTLEEVAEHLGVSRRTLQRRFLRVGTSYTTEIARIQESAEGR